MFIRAHFFATLVAVSTAFAAAPALADIVITQQKALAGNITPGDQAGFPITLSLPGSYSFGGNITVPAGRNGIEITGADVTLDLNGFFMTGGGTAGNGIIGSQRAATIVNGTIIGFGQDGINSDAPFWIIRDMRVLTSKGFNAVGCGPSCHIEGSIVALNQSQGVDTQSGGGAVIGNVIVNNGGQGVASAGAGIAHNALILNDGNRAGNTVQMHPNLCISTTGLGSC